ncbi:MULTISPECIES: hypothetical protein [unclassified Schlesneria]|uniref:hypothetical protein n=1 Tax=unclassified Schlesneria TaxID=2762017 RepID=UPI002F17139B
MLTSLILAVAISAADPYVVFEHEHAQIADSVTGQPLVPESYADPSYGFPQGQQVLPGQPIYTGQPVYGYPQGPPVFYPIDAVWQDPWIQKRLSEMNPLSPYKYPILENYFDPYGWQMLTGSYGPQPYRLGWTTFNEFSFLPSSTASGTTGAMQMTEWNSNAKYARVLTPGLLFDATLWFSAHWWEGPGGISLPPHVDQLSSDLMLGFYDDGPWSAQIAFHPQIVKTYGASLDANAYNFDGRAILTYSACEHWKVVLGLAIWDRVDTLFVPHAGLIWTPDDRWEVRALFPTSKISYFLGNWARADFWVYGQYEYTAESWQTVLSDPTLSERAQFIDQRLTAGIRWDHQRYSFNAEVGYVFDRQTKFNGPSPNFTLADSAIISLGVRY